jgi:hypothetical protein
MMGGALGVTTVCGAYDDDANASSAETLVLVGL